MQSRPGRGVFAAGLCALVAAGAVGLGAPAPARACGGLVCAGGPSGVVTQANERILFVVSGDGAGSTVTAVIQIQYAGRPDEFAWILPVMEVPVSIDVASPTFFDELDRATAPTFQFLFGGGFGGGGGGGGSAGCGVPAARRSYSSDGGVGWTEPNESAVNVWGTGTVGPFELAVISSDTVEPLLEWIYRHGFQAPEAFAAIADDYVKENFKFVVVRLAPDADVNQLAPLVLVTRESYPCVPLRLTSVAAQPDMGILVYVAGPSRAVPINYEMAAPDYRDLAAVGVAGYETLIRDAVDAEGGKAWVTEMAEPMSEALSNGGTGATVTDSAVLAILGDSAYLTRLYTKMSDFEMDEDPFFTFEPGGVDVSNERNVSSDSVTSASTGAGGAALLAGEAALALGLGGLGVWRRIARRRRER